MKSSYIIYYGSTPGPELAALEVSVGTLETVPQRQCSFDKSFISREPSLQLMELASNPSINREISADWGGFVGRLFYITSRIVLHMPNAPTCSVFTAPHSLQLKRDNKPDHKRERHTYELAVAFAELSNGAALTWSVEENSRVRGLPGPDPSNRDPNFLLDTEARDATSNPWLFGLNMCQIHFQNPESAIHVDIHGMQDVDEADLCIGYAAMARRNDWTSAEKEAFEQSIRTSFDNFDCDFRGVAINEIKMADGNIKRLCGDWFVTAHRGRNTLTQVSTNHNWFLDGMHFHRALQMELSVRLRKRLVEDQQLKIKFLQCLFKIEFPAVRGV
jgi:hypothetical protein